MHGLRTGIEQPDYRASQRPQPAAPELFLRNHVTLLEPATEAYMQARTAIRITVRSVNQQVGIGEREGNRFFDKNFFPHLQRLHHRPYMLKFDCGDHDRTDLVP